MSCLKFSFFLIFLSHAAMANMFSSRLCLMSKFDTEIEHEGKFFGLVKNKLSIKKDNCLIEVNYKNILDTKWIVDICREPIHVKVQSRGSMEFFKRKNGCESKSDKFCSSWRELKQILQDHGLIFAKGERESLESAHGKTYCSYLLMNKYLGEGVLFSKYKNTPDIFTKVKPEVEKKAEVNDPQEEKEEQPVEKEVDNSARF